MKRSRKEFQNNTNRIQIIVDAKPCRKSRRRQLAVVVPFSIGLCVAFVVASFDAAAAFPALGDIVTKSLIYSQDIHPQQSSRRLLDQKQIREDGQRGVRNPRKTEESIDKSNAAPIPSDNNSSGEEVCRLVDKCQRCTFSEQRAYNECKATGRWEKFQCVPAGGEGGDAGRTEMRSCKYTEADEEFAMVRLQMLCFLIGCLAIASVRRQKRLSASLFDQRTMAQQSQNDNGFGAGGSGTAASGIPSNKPQKKRSMLVTDNDEEIEFTPMTNQQRVEMVPLMPTDGYDDDDDDDDDLEVV